MVFLPVFDLPGKNFGLGGAFHKAQVLLLHALGLGGVKGQLRQGELDLVVHILQAGFGAGEVKALGEGGGQLTDQAALVL